jgi:hypothetical protein
MQKSFNKFIYSLAIFSAILAVIALILHFVVPADIIHATLPLLFLLFITVTVLVHYLLLRSTNYSGSKFVSFFMAATFLKLFLYLIIIILYAFLIKKDVVSFILSFFILYMLYTSFEVVMILKQTKK